MSCMIKQIAWHATSLLWTVHGGCDGQYSVKNEMIYFEECKRRSRGGNLPELDGRIKTTGYQKNLCKFAFTQFSMMKAVAGG
ncbi:MAG: hypothetical protein ACRYGK_05085 [Janthinobacterium lividum]